MTRLSVAVLDTSVLIDRPATLGMYAEGFVVTAVSIGELAFGLQVARNPIELSYRERNLRNILSSCEPAPYTADAAHWFGAMCALVQQSGRNPRARVADLMIAAIAKSLGAGVITRNPDDFRGIEAVVPIVAITD